MANFVRMVWCTRADALLGVEGIHVNSVSATRTGLVLRVETSDDLTPQGLS